MAIVSVILTSEQADQLKPLVMSQGTGKGGLLLCSASPFFDSDSGEVRMKLQAVYLPWKQADKVLALIRRATEPNEPT
jgi:hypothetical protein